VSRLLLFIIGLLGLLLVLGAAVVLWRRYYRDDADNPVRRILKNSAVPFITRLTAHALDFIFLLVLYSTLPGAEIGPYTLAALLVAQYLGTFSEFGLGVLLTREVAQQPTAAQRLFGATLLLRWLLVVASVPIAAALIGIYDLLALFGVGEAITPAGQQAIWILLLTLVPSAYAGAVTALYNAAERMEVPAVIELVTAMLSMLARIGVLLLGFGIIGLAWAAVAVTSITALIYLWLQLSGDIARPSLKWERSLMLHLVPLALPLMLNNLLNVVFFRFDMFIIKAFAPGDGDLLLQQYALPYQVIKIALILPPVVTFAVFPLLSRRAMGERAALAYAQNRTLHLLMLLAFPLAMGMGVLAPDLVRFFTRSNAPDYLPISANVLSMLVWFLPLSFINGLLQYVLIAINQQRAITRAFLIGAAFNLVVNLLAIPYFSLYAASIVTILSEVVLLAVFWPLLRREGLTPPLLALCWRPALAALIMGEVMLLATYAGWLAAVLVAPPLYAALLWWLGAFGAAERALLRRVMQRE
jgi:O-antigen/teichoic acid export membrane protein